MRNETRREREEKLIQFPYAARRVRQRPVADIPDNKDFTTHMKWFFWWFFCVPAMFTIAAIVILILMGALKLVGVKEL
jgi:hypothetical protein